MPTSKEEICRKYNLTEEEADTVVGLALRPICEHCAKPLPPQSTEARICSFECTFCADCVTHVLGDVCPNCGGGFVPRPIRPAKNWRNNNYLGAFPPTETKKHKPVNPEVHRVFSAPLRLLKPRER